MTIKLRKDAETVFSAGTLSAVREAELGNYMFDAAMADMNADWITFLATAPGADDLEFTIHTDA